MKPIYVDLDIIENITGYRNDYMHIDSIMRYIEKTGNINIELNPNDFICLGQALSKYTITAFQENGIAAFQFLGINFYLCCGERLNRIRLLK